ncbi:hypothetical protein Pla22_28440 [Rubripirellula amarantea]|uniref:Uncharacterized protein n=1 Tax=Rubripirellula amarantea TaxID=2527999 RepID=A0A5C5WY36_9BACT|nr:hypothetical protein Pla22_28440 [Rubripirellula amarantea]
MNREFNIERIFNVAVILIATLSIGIVFLYG